jgi:hypothetical protein
MLGVKDYVTDLLHQRRGAPKGDGDPNAAPAGEEENGEGVVDGAANPAKGVPAPPPPPPPPNPDDDASAPKDAAGAEAAPEADPNVPPPPNPGEVATPPPPAPITDACPNPDVNGEAPKGLAPNDAGAGAGPPEPNVGEENGVLAGAAPPAKPRGDGCPKPEPKAGAAGAGVLPSVGVDDKPNMEGSRLYRLARLRNSCSSLPWYFASNRSTSPTLFGLYCW